MDETAQLCNDPYSHLATPSPRIEADRPFCVEGWRTDIGDFLRFPTKGGAERWSIILGDDGRHWETFVLDMSTYELTFGQRMLAVDLLFSSRDW